MGLLLSRTHLRGENNSLQSAYYTDHLNNSKHREKIRNSCNDFFIVHLPSKMTVPYLATLVCLEVLH